MQKVLFIINPMSGTHRQKKMIEKYARQYLPAQDFELHFAYTEYAGHAIKLSNNARNIFDIVVAVGGDGTIHEVAQPLVHSSTSLAIIPMGSGNGLARFLHIPLYIRSAIRVIAKGQTMKIDTILCNNEYVLNVAGFGFDAIIGDLFNVNISKRGGLKYIQLVSKELFHYKAQTFTFHIDNKEFTRTFFIGTVANANQYGLNAHIAPTADITDGKFEVVFIDKFPPMLTLKLAVDLFSNRINRSKYVETLQADSLTIKNTEPYTIHMDGEPRIMYSDINFSIAPHSLSIITGI
jgi:YegS/Rv2252/BmrU family lipid kinase